MEPAAPAKRGKGSKTPYSLPKVKGRYGEIIESRPKGGPVNGRNGRNSVADIVGCAVKPRKGAYPAEHSFAKAEWSLWAASTALDAVRPNILDEHLYKGAKGIERFLKSVSQRTRWEHHNRLHPGKPLKQEFDLPPRKRGRRPPLITEATRVLQDPRLKQRLGPSLDKIPNWYPEMIGISNDLLRRSPLSYTRDTERILSLTARLSWAVHCLGLSPNMSNRARRALSFLGPKVRGSSSWVLSQWVLPGGHSSSARYFGTGDIHSRLRQCVRHISTSVFA